MGIQQLLLGSGNNTDIINLLGCSESDVVSSPDTAIVAYAIDSSGVEVGISGITTTFTNQAVTPSSRTSAYEVRLSGSGTTPTGSALNTWLALTSSRSWQLSRSVDGSVGFTGTIEIRLVGGGTIIDSAAVSLSATVTP